MLGRPVELIQQARARRPWPSGERQQRRLAVARSRCLLTTVAREHEAVDHKRVLAGLKQLREPVRRSAPRPPRPPARCSQCLPVRGRQLAPRGGDRLHRPPQPDLPLQQPIARSPALTGRLAHPQLGRPHDETLYIIPRGARRRASLRLRTRRQKQLQRMRTPPLASASTRDRLPQRRRPSRSQLLLRITEPPGQQPVRDRPVGDIPGASCELRGVGGSL